MNKGCVNDEIENRHSANNRGIIVADPNHRWVLQLMGEIMILNRVFVLPQCISP